MMVSIYNCIQTIKPHTLNKQNTSKPLHNTHFNLSFLRRNINGTIGTIFPKTQIGRIVVMGNPIQTPTGTAPRNSTTGMADMMANTAKSGIPNDRKKLATFCPVCKCSTVSAAFLAACAAGCETAVIALAIVTKVNTYFAIDLAVSLF